MLTGSCPSSQYINHTFYMCSEYLCSACGCNFFFPCQYATGNATENFEVRCPKCGSTNTNLV